LYRLLDLSELAVFTYNEVKYPEYESVGPTMSISRSTSVTFLFADPGDSLTLWEQHTAAMQAALPHFRSALQQAVLAQHGEVFNLSNDTLQAAFQNATDAVNAALQAQNALLSIAWDLPLHPRLALLTGSAHRQENEFFGPALHRTARLLSVAHGNQVLLCSITADLARSSLPPDVSLLDLGEHRLADLTHPERLFQLTAPGLPEDFPPLKSLDNQATNLPIQPNPLVGRQPELQSIAQMLRSGEVRLLTLTGIGGTGKTRLALQAAADLLAAFPDGVFFAPLDQVADPALVAFAIAQALSLEQSGNQSIEKSLQTHLRERRTLLVLDNFEHLLPAAALVSELLAACPQLKIMVTSREGLRLRNEREFPVNPLPLPDPLHSPPPDQLAQFASVALFIQRAQAARPDFTLNSATAPAVAEICAFLDGLPLAIELAAARVRMFSPQALLARLKAQPNLQLLSAGPRDQPARQQTLQNTLAWSYNLLNTDEQSLFRRLGVFAGGFTPEAVEAVCYPGGDQSEDIFTELTSLMEKSMLRRSEDGADQNRLSMLFILRQFAVGLLEQAGELPAYRQAHAAYYLTLAEQAEPDDQIQALSPAQMSPEILRRLIAEEENLRAALQYSLTISDPELALRLVNALEQYWGDARSYFHEASHWTEAVITKTRGIKSLRRAKALRTLVYSLVHINPLLYASQIEAFIAEAIDIYTLLDSPLNACSMLWYRAKFEHSTGERKKAIVLLDQCIRDAGILGNKYLQARAGATLAWILMLEDELDRGRKVAEEGVMLSRELGDPYALDHSIINLAWIAYEQDQIEYALQCIREDILLDLPAGLGTMDFLYLLSGVAIRMGQKRIGAELGGAAQRMRDITGLQEGMDAQYYDQ
jgi:predicted ATPase/class 3 adenylate cyclase